MGRRGIKAKQSNTKTHLIRCVLAPESTKVPRSKIPTINASEKKSSSFVM